MRKSWKERNKYMRKNERNANDNIRRIITPSILGIMICMVCLAGTTWAWFTATEDAAVAESQVARFDVKADIQEIGKDTIKGDGVETYSINSDKEYKVTLTAGGTAKGGYCAVSVDGKTYYTAYMAKGDDLSFTVCSRDGDMTVATSWNEMTRAGSSARKAMSRTKSAPLREGDVIGEGEPAKEDENKDNSNSPDTAKKAPVIKEEEKNDSTPAQGSDDNNSDDNSTPAQDNTPEQGSDSESGTSETHAAE